MNNNYGFHNLTVYEKAKQHKVLVYTKIKPKHIDLFFKNQLFRATLSIVLNIAEGTGRPSKPARRNFYSIARSSTYECVALLEVLLELTEITDEEYNLLVEPYHEISRMLYALINSC